MGKCRIDLLILKQSHVGIYKPSSPLIALLSSAIFHENMFSTQVEDVMHLLFISTYHSTMREILSIIQTARGWAIDKSWISR